MNTKLSIKFHKDDKAWYVYHGEGMEEHEYIFDYWEDVQRWINNRYFDLNDYSFAEEGKRREKAEKFIEWNKQQEYKG